MSQMCTVYCKKYFKMEFNDFVSNCRMMSLGQLSRRSLHRIPMLSPAAAAVNIGEPRSYKSGSKSGKIVLPRMSNVTPRFLPQHQNYQWPGLIVSNNVSTSGGGLGVAKKQEVSQYLTLAEAPDKSLNKAGNSPLVLFFPWLGATRSSVDKYCELYHSRGWDVLLVNATAKHFLWPSNAKTVVSDVLDYVTSKAVLDERTDFLVHSMSIGAFIYTVLFIELQEQPGNYQEFRNKLRGQIFDSIVIGGIKRMGKGVASSITKNPLGNLSIRALVATYLAVTKKYTVDYYDYSVKFFHDKPLTIPTLIYYSLDDPNSDPYAMENLIGTWRADYPKMSLIYKCWAKSVHTAHLRQHREEYLAELTHFLTKIQLSDSTVIVRSNL